MRGIAVAALALCAAAVCATEIAPTAAVSDIVSGRWRFEVRADDVPESADRGAVPPKSDIESANELADASLLQRSWAAVSNLVHPIAHALTRDPTAGFLRLAPSAHLGAFVGEFEVNEAGAAVMRAQGFGAAPAPGAKLDTLVTCVTLNRCTLTFSHREEAPAPYDGGADDDDVDDKANVTANRTQPGDADAAGSLDCGSVEVTAQQRAMAHGVPRHIAFATFTMAGDAPQPTVSAVLQVIDEKHLTATLAARVDGGARTWRFHAYREVRDLTVESEDGAPSWASTVFALLLLVIVVGGKFGVAWWFRRQGIPVDQWTRSLYNRDKNKRARKKALPSDEEVARMMARDTAMEKFRAATHAQQQE